MINVNRIDGTTYRPKKNELIREAKIIDIASCIGPDGNLCKVVLGRLCAHIAYILRGKHKSIFTPGVDCGDRVIVLNSDKITVTGRKLTRNILYKHTGYVGNMKERLLKDRLAKDSTEVIRTAVKRMLPSGPLGRAQLRLLHVFPTSEHNQHALKPQAFDFNTFFGGING